MKRTALTVVLIAVTGLLAVSAASAQAAPRAPVPLVTPANGAKVKDPVVTFVWDFVPGAVAFRTTVKNMNGSQSITLTSTDANCFMLRCAVTLDAAVEGWLWKEGATYSWQVRAKNASNENAGKSKVRTFTVDMLKNIKLLEPDNGDVAEVTEVLPSLVGFPVEWSAISANAYYVLTLYRKDGTIKSTLSVPDVHCGSSCTFILPVEDMPVGQLKTFYLQITGTLPYVSGKMKSPKIKIKLVKL